MRIEFVRSGGVAGVVRRCRLDTCTLAPEQRREIEHLVEAADLPALAARPASTARGADRFRYEITVVDEGRRARVHLGDGAVPPRLRPLLDRLLLEARGG